MGMKHVQQNKTKRAQKNGRIRVTSCGSALITRRCVFPSSSRNGWNLSDIYGAFHFASEFGLSEFTTLI